MIAVLLQAFFFVSMVNNIAASPATHAINVWLTSSNLSTGSPLLLLAPQNDIDKNWSLTGNSKMKALSRVNVEIDSKTLLQSIVGYGAGLPQSSAFVLIGLKRRSPPLYNTVMERIFGAGESSARMTVIRFPIGSCDFSIQNTSYDENANDFDLTWFKIDEDRSEDAKCLYLFKCVVISSELIIEVLQDAIKINPTLKLIGDCHISFSPT